MTMTGWANTVLYRAGNFSAHRGFSMTETPYGAGDIWGALAFLGGSAGMAFTNNAVLMLTLSAFEKAKG